MKLHQKIFGIGLLTAVIVPHLYEKGYIIALPCIYRSPVEDTEAIRITARSASDDIIGPRQYL